MARWPGGQVTWRPGDLVAGDLVARWPGDLVARFDITPAQVAALFGVLGSGLGAAGTGVGIAAVIFLFSDHQFKKRENR